MTFPRHRTLERLCPDPSCQLPLCLWDWAALFSP
jgi:hypothetical protein